jgi:hypothetical protein
MPNEYLTPDQITWLNVSGCREVKRLPSHFVCVVHSFGSPASQTPWHNASYQTWMSMDDTPWSEPKCLNMFRAHIENTFSGRYFISFNKTGRPSAVADSQTLLVAFEDPAEASFFSLQFDYLIKKIGEKLSKKK